MDGAKLLLYRILDVLKLEFQWSELFLNTLFIGLVVLISFIIYWNTINNKVSKTSRCKRQIDIYNKNKGLYEIQATDRYKEPLFNITYDVNQGNTNIECSCKPGKYVNYFNDIPVRNLRTNKDTKVDKVCTCDKYHNVGNMNDNIKYDGEPGILRYMSLNDTDFFNSMLYSPYN